MEYAVLETGGKQYKVETGDIIEVERLSVPEGTDFDFDRVLLNVSGDTVAIGTPFITGAVVKAKVISNTLGDKIRVSQFKAKSRHRRVIGHRQSLTKIQITGIGKSAVKKEVKVKKALKK